MLLGRYKLGQFVAMFCKCRDDQVRYAPTACPVATIYDGDGAKVEVRRLPVVDRFASPGLFILAFQLGDDYDIGHYSVAINFKANSKFFVVTNYFEVVDGGDVNGAVISMEFFDRPHARFLVQKLDSFQRNIVKNPRSS